MNMVNNGLVSCKLLVSHRLFARKKTIARRVEIVRHYMCLLKTLANEYSKKLLSLFQFAAPIRKIYLCMFVERIS